MHVGTVVGERFELRRFAAAGGMGAVFEAFDRLENTRVALKVLHAVALEQVQRFRREAQMLADLPHSGFVRYVAHGVSPQGEPYLVMEWLEGEDLDSRLKRGPLSIEDSVLLMIRVARTMALAHRRGIVHRDLKPTNLWLLHGDVTLTKVLDLGLARPVERARLALSRTGAAMGTPGYMAPEQARGSADLDVRADVFSMGCVLYECLTGKPAYNGEHAMAVLAKILFEEAPRVSGLFPDVPVALDELVCAMLSREPSGRPADAAAVAAALHGFGSVQGEQRIAVSAHPAALTTREQRVLCVLVAGRSKMANADGAATIITAELIQQRDTLRAIAHQYDGELELLADSCIIATFSSAGHATDLAVQAARAALAIRPFVPELAFALATGRGVIGDVLTVGEAVEKASRYLAQTRAGEIRLDEISAGLLEMRFHVDAGRLVAERELPGGERLLLGKPTACVGREREIAAVEAAFADCVSERSPQVVLVTAPAGAGKSRLRYEFLHRNALSDAEVWIGLGDPMRAGAPLGLLGQAIRWAMGINGSVPLSMQQHVIRARVERVVESSEAGRIAEFLGELVGVPFPGEHSVPLRAARQDAMLMADQMLRAWQDWLSAESSDKVIVLVFEDVHWGDLPTVKFVDAALRDLKDRAIFVLALGRPEVHELFPRLWAERGALELHLRQLPRKACEALARQVLGENFPSELVARVVDRSEGNAFYLEELIRTVAEGTTDLPPSVIAVLQLRLSALPDRLRLALRAGSIFGNLFFPRAVAFLLGEQDATLVESQLADLSEREWIGRARHSRFADEATYAFRHALVREAAYATLTEADRTLGHRLAAEWLERAGETEAIVIAEHWERGRHRERAIGWYQRAAEQAMESNDLKAAIARAERAVACGASGDALGALRALQAEAYNWGAEFGNAERCAEEAMILLPPGSALWAHAIHQASWACTSQRQEHRAELFAEEILAHTSAASLTRLHALALAYVATHLQYLGRSSELMPLLLAPIESADHLKGDPLLAGTVSEVRGRLHKARGDLAGALEHFEKALADYERAGDARRICMMQENCGGMLVLLGELNEGESALGRAAAAASRLGLLHVQGACFLQMGLSLAHQGRHAEAIALARRELETLGKLNQPADLVEGRLYLSRFLSAAGDFETAETEAAHAVAASANMPILHQQALATHARALLGVGQYAQAASAATRAVEILDSTGESNEWEAFIRAVHVQALHDAGDDAGARAALAKARALILERAALIQSDAKRALFLTRVPEHALTLALAAEWQLDLPNSFATDS